MITINEYSKDNEVLIIKISSKTTQKELDEIEAQISKFDVDFKIKKAKFKKDKLIVFGFRLLDENGIKTTFIDDTTTVSKTYA